MITKIRKLLAQLQRVIQQCRGTLATVDGYFDNLGYHPDPTTTAPNIYKQTVNKP